MQNPSGNSTLISIAVAGTAVIASMRRNNASNYEVVAMAGVFCGLLLSAVGNQRSSNVLRWSGIAIMAISLLVVALDWLR